MQNYLLLQYTSIQQFRLLAVRVQSSKILVSYSEMSDTAYWTRPRFDNDASISHWQYAPLHPVKMYQYDEEVVFISPL